MLPVGNTFACELHHRLGPESLIRNYAFVSMRWRNRPMESNGENVVSRTRHLQKIDRDFFTASENGSCWMCTLHRLWISSKRMAKVVKLRERGGGEAVRVITVFCRLFRRPIIHLAQKIMTTDRRTHPHVLRSGWCLSCGQMRCGRILWLPPPPPASIAFIVNGRSPSAAIHSS